MTSTASLVLLPLDTLFFRDGRPFDVDDEGLVEAASLFPPHPSMVAGALRAAYGRRSGRWPGFGRWNDPALTSWLGDGGCLGRMRYRGPFLLQGSGGLGPFDLLFPCPAALLGRRPDAQEEASRDFGTYADIRLLAPGSAHALSTDCDGRVPAAELPGDRTEEFESLSGRWISLPLMRQVLAGGPFRRLPAILASSDVFRQEKRLGLARSFEQHVAFDGQLYATAKVRLKENYALGAIVESRETDDLSLSGILPLGGESRAVGVETLAGGVCRAENNRALHRCAADAGADRSDHQRDRRAAGTDRRGCP
jgi:CRISPR-associated protein Cmr3